MQVEGCSASSFVTAGGRVEIVIVEPLERRWGHKISKRGHWRDSLRSSKKRSVSTPGLRWMSMALVVTLSWTRVRWALPDFACPAHHAQGQQSAQETTQDADSPGAANGPGRPSLASQP